MKKFDLEDHICDNFKSYVIVVIFFIIGVIAGTIVDISISEDQKAGIIKYVMNFLNSKDSTVSNLYLLKVSLFSNIKVIALLWVLGVSVVGFPIVLFTIGYKGFALGFCSTFFIEKFKLKGFLFVLFTIFPQNIIAVPCFIFASVIALKFSTIMLSSFTSGFNKGRKSNSVNFSLGEYSFQYLAAFFFISFSSLFEAYVVPVLIKLPLFQF